MRDRSKKKIAAPKRVRRRLKAISTQANLIARQRRREQGPEKSEARFRSYFELGLIGMAMTSPTKGIVEVNDELCRILGYERRELLKKSWAEMTHPDDLAADLAQFNRVIAGEIDGYTMDKRWIRKDGQIIDSIMAARCLRRADGSLDYFVGFVLDTTERKRAEEKLRRSEILLAEGQRLSHTASWAWNVSTGEVYWSAELFRIYGLSPKRVKSGYPSVLIYIHPEDRSRVQKTFEDAVRAQREYELAYRVVRPNGMIRHVSNVAQPVFDQAGILTEYVGTAMDITERKEAEEAVRKAHERVDLILESISDQFLSLSKDWRFTYFNQHAAAQMRRLGKDPKRLIGKVLWEEFPEVPNEANLRRVMSERIAISDELYYAPLGEWLANHMYPSEDGGLVTFQRYITARKRTEEKLKQTEAELAHAQRVTTMGEMAASIAHEINQPLGAIVNNGNVCLQLVGVPNSEQKKREALLDIVHDANRASAIIARIRGLTKRSTSEKTLLSVKELIDDVLVMANRAATNAGVKVTTSVPDSLRVAGERIQLQQMLLNLVMNAIEAMSNVEVAKRTMIIRGNPGELEKNPAVIVSVRDNGLGFSSENANRLFEPFFTTKSNGMGMGLGISRSIVESHGGRLWAKRNARGGATFYCAWPAEKNVA
jgi:PAS domain S-box-containing protein